MTINAQKIRNSLVSLAMPSTASERTTVGQYAPFDADWNYKDIPHLAEVHHQVDGVVIEASDVHISNIFLQKVGPFSIPMIVYIGEQSGAGIVYFGIAGPFVLMISTTWESIDSTRTRVVTRYEVFSKRLLRPFHGLIHRMLSRNYDVLMSADLPMREQRGRLRASGYTFAGDTTGYAFRQSTNVHLRNVITPEVHRKTSIDLRIEDVVEGSSVHGGKAEDGVRVDRRGSIISLYPRICNHEGADLECAALQGSGLRCPWHGRVVKPIGVVDLASNTVTDVAADTKIHIDGRQLRIERSL